MRTTYLLALVLLAIFTNSKSSAIPSKPSFFHTLGEDVLNTSSITLKTGYTYSSNIDYKSYQSSSFALANSIGVMGLTLNDAGGDGLSTTLSSITFSISTVTSNIVRTAALYSNSVRVSSYAQVTNGASSITFNSGSGWPMAVSDGATKDFELRVTFKTAIVENQQIQFTVSSVTELAGGSSFAAADGGGAASSVSGNINKMSVTADRLKFTQQPSSVYAGNIISPTVTVKAVDLYNNVDVDYVAAVKLNITNPTPSCDTLAGNLVNASAGVASFPNLNPNVAEDRITLTATGTGISGSVVSSLFDVFSAQYNNILNWNFSDNDIYADGGTDPLKPSRVLATSATGAINIGDCVCAGNAVAPSAYAAGWDNGSGSKYWQVDFSTLGTWDIRVSFRQRSTPTGPRDFKVQSKVGTGNWEDIATVPALVDSFKYNLFRIPSFDSSFKSYPVSFRWIMTSNASVDTTSSGLVDAAGASYIDDIKIVGISTTNAKQLYYRSTGSGAFESSCNWETSTSSAGPWSQAKGAPDFSAYDIRVRAPDTISINQAIDLDGVIVDPGATLVLNNADLFILDDGPGASLTVNGTFIDNSTGTSDLSFGTNGTWLLGAAGTFIKTGNSKSNAYRINYEGGMSAIPSTANWIIRYTGSYSPVFTTDSTYYPNLTIESTNGNWDPGATAGSYFSGSTANGAFATIKGNLDIGGTGTGTVKISNINTNAQPLLVKGNMIIRSGSELNNTLNSTYGTGFEIKGNVSVDGTLNANGGSGRLKLSGSALQTISGSGVINVKNFSVANTGAGVSLTRALTVLGTDSLIQGTFDPGINTLTLSGPIIRTTGNLNGKANTTVLNGTSLQTIPSNAFLNNTIKNLNISNNVAFAGLDTITGILSITGGSNTLTTNNNITLKSTASGTAAVDQIPNGNNIVGDVTVERYISARRGWRFLSVPTNTTQTFHDAWQEGMPQGSVTQTTPAGYGTQITNNIATWFADGFDYYSPDGPSLKKYNSATNNYTGIAKTFDPIATTEGLMTFVRGDRTASGLSAVSTLTVLRTKGPLYTGPQPAITVSAGKFTSIGNPYAAPLDMRKINKSAGVSDKFYLYDPNLNSLGGFQTFIKIGSDYYPSPGGGSYPSQATPTPYNFIASGDAFFATASSNGTITFKEDAKGSGDLPLVFRPAKISQAMLRCNLYTIESNGSATLADGILEQFDNKFTDNIDDFDALKFSNFSENLAIKAGSQLLAIERRGVIEKKDTIQLNIEKMKVKSYRFEINEQDLDPSLTGFLEDSYNNVSIPLKINSTTVYDFSVMDIPGSWNPSRFRVVFMPDVRQLQSSFKSLNAFQQNKQIVVEWKVNEKNIKEYEVEKSSDGQQFISGTLINAKNSNNSIVSYQWTDFSPFQKDNYYRIKSIGITGEVQYSHVVKVFIAASYPQISIYPNPVIDGLINVMLADEPEGIYKARLISNSGQVLQTTHLMHSAGTGTHPIQVNKNLAKGNYTLEIITPGNNKINNKILLQ